MKIIIGTTNKLKIECAKNILSSLTSEFILKEFPAFSGVSETPHNKEILDGAFNRAKIALNSEKEADFGIGLESGLSERYGEIYEEAWAVVIKKNKEKFVGYSSGLKVPSIIIQKMKEKNKKHWEVMKKMEKELNLIEKETWGNYSGGFLIRKISLEEALRNALVQCFQTNKTLY